jgi:membrane fusion protein, multidrug efflux system
MNSKQQIMTTNKRKIMRQTLTITAIAFVAVVLASCGGGAKDEKGELNDKKVKLEKLKKEKNTLDVSIRQLEQEISKADPNAEQARKLISVDTVLVQDFSHYIELQGKVDAEGMAYVAPRGQGGVVKAIYVQTGGRVSKGQLVLKLDDALQRQGVVAAQQQIGGVKAQLAQAKSIYERQQNLWKQNIGTEVQVLNAKTNVEALESQLRSAEANVSIAQEQVALTNVYAQIGGVIDVLNVKVGEFFSPQSAADPRSGIRIVNNNNLKVVTNVPENYISRVKKGDKVQIVIPESGKAAWPSVISVVGAAINETNRSFTAEAKLPSDPFFKPNQIATMKILDYQAKSTIAVPVNVVQTDEKGKYVYVMEKTSDKMVARKKPVIVGEAYEGLIEIKSGLAAGELIITEGYQTVYDGQAVTTGK